MAGALRVLREEEIDCVAGGSMEGAGDPNWMPPSGSWAFDGVPVVAGSSFGLGNSSTFGGYAAYQAAQAAANDRAWAAASTPDFGDKSNLVYTAPISTENMIVVNAATLQGLLPSASLFADFAAAAANACQGISFSDIYFYWMPDGDIEDFKEFLVEQTDTTCEELGQLFVATSVVGEDKFALVWDNTGHGEIYRVTDHYFTDDTYNLMGGIQITGVSASQSSGAGVTNTGGSLNIGNGQSVTYIYTGPAG